MFFNLGLRDKNTHDVQLGLETKYSKPDRLSCGIAHVTPRQLLPAWAFGSTAVASVLWTLLCASHSRLLARALSVPVGSLAIAFSVICTAWSRVFSPTSQRIAILLVDPESAH